MSLVRSTLVPKDDFLSRLCSKIKRITNVYNSNSSKKKKRRRRGRELYEAAPSVRPRDSNGLINKENSLRKGKLWASLFVAAAAVQLQKRGAE